MPHAMRHLRSSCLAVLAGSALLALSSCASGPSFPDPQPGKGQIMVSLKATPKQGVTGPRKDRVVDDYATRDESVESGKQFQRVKYEAIADTVVLCSGGSGPTASALVAKNDGFDHAQVALCNRGTSNPATLTVSNKRATALTLFATPREDEVVGVKRGGGEEMPFQVLELSLAPGQSGDMVFLHGAIYDLSCDEDQSLACVVYVTNGGAWIGSTRDKAFFDGLAPGEYDLVVYGPRLPVVRQTVKVAAGARAQAEAELTVNGLQKCGH